MHRLIFICSSLEPGRDGVGDYTRRMAGALIKIHYPVSIVSINDTYVSDQTAGKQIVGDTAVPVTRLPHNWSWKQRIDSLISIVENTRPEWISLQYVLYGFHNKGLPFSLSRHLSRIRGCKWHIMFHELWSGMDDNRNLKEGVYARLQSYIIFRMLSDLKPEVLHTQTVIYQAQLAKRGYTASILPLFGNIPVRTRHLPERKNQIAVFGTIYPEALIEEFAAAYMQLKGTGIFPLKLLFIGRNGAEKERWIKVCQGATIFTEVLGEVSEEKVSEALQTCIAGVSTTPALLADKSGVVAALREHNLPVIDLARHWKAKGVSNISSPEDLLSIHSFFEAYCHGLLSGKSYSFGLEYTVRLFIHDLHLKPL